eukprot:COSAG06_NODE_196_length_20472_cov_49.724207_19_plen_176_part_00
MQSAKYKAGRALWQSTGRAQSVAGKRQWTTGRAQSVAGKRQWTVPEARLRQTYVIRAEQLRGSSQHPQIHHHVVQRPTVIRKIGRHAVAAVAQADLTSAVPASGVTGVTHPCITGLLTPASSPCSPLHQRAASARASRCSAVPGLPSVTRILQPRVTRILQSRVTRILQSTRVRS